AESVGDKQAPCSEICRRLLFNRVVEQVRMTRMPDPNHFMRPGGMSYSVTYHVDHRDSCPQVSPFAEGGKAFLGRLNAGECLIAEAENDGPKDATVSFTTLFDRDLSPWPFGDRSTNAATGKVIRKLARLTIVQRGDDGAAVPIVRRTEITAGTVSL